MHVSSHKRRLELFGLSTISLPRRSFDGSKIPKELELFNLLFKQEPF